MINDLYSDKLLTAAASLPPAGRLDAPDASAKKVSRVCGSEVDIDLKLDGDVVSGFGIEARACALGQASAGILANTIIGARASELFTLRDQMRAMLKEEGSPPNGRFADLAALQVVADYPQRHASTMLVFEAVCDALSQLGFAQNGRQTD